VSASVPTADTLRRLAEALRAEGGLLAAALAPDSERDARIEREGDPALGGRAARGPRAAGREEELALVVEAIREGYLLHYASGRLLGEDDRDLILLAGDRLYALGLARLAALGDLDAIGELADVISLGAQAHAEGRPDVAEAVWAACAAAVGWGADGGLQAAKAAARAGDPGAADVLRAAARRVAGDAAPVR
jgi:hypothetical protein